MAWPRRRRRRRAGAGGLVASLAGLSVGLAAPAHGQATQELGESYLERFLARDAAALHRELSERGRERYPDPAALGREEFVEPPCRPLRLVREYFSCYEIAGMAPYCDYGRRVLCEGLERETSFTVTMEPDGRLREISRVDHRPPSLWRRLQTAFPFLDRDPRQLAAFAVALTVLTTLLTLVVLYHVRKHLRARAWLAAAEGLGLGPVERAGANKLASGRYRETAVTAGVTISSSRSAGTTTVSYVPWVRASFPTPLGLGFRLRPGTGQLARALASSFDAPRLETGVPEFDRAFTVRAADEAGARRLLRAPVAGEATVAEYLLRHPDRGRFEVDDDTVTLRPRRVGKEAELRAALDQAVELVERLRVAAD